jgi:UPF0755 protein
MGKFRIGKVTLGGHPGYWVVLGILTALVLFMGAMLGYGTLGTSLDATDAAVVEVRAGESFKALTGRLSQEGTLHDRRFLLLLALLRGDTGRIKVGDYIFHGRVSPLAFLDALVSGKGEFTTFTVPEGYALKDIAQRIDEEGLGSGREFLRLCHDPAFIASLNLPLQPAPVSLEGLVFPETYYLYRGVRETHLIQAMVQQFKRRAWPLLKGGGPRGLGPYAALILASIIEKETGAESERPLVSAVFHNRLRQGINLGSDPTVIYGVADFDGNLTRVHLRTPTPFNTYTHPGLPPTPIASPGLASIQAALAPAPVRYLYFVSRGDGTHQFSNDYRTHLRAVDRYQRRGKRGA